MTNRRPERRTPPSKKIKAKSDTVDRRRSKGWVGTATVSRSHSRSCYFYGYSGDLTLDCWGGREAVANYGFRLPSNARNVTWEVRGERNCCNNGRVVKSGQRTSDTRFGVRVRVTNWASYTVRAVYVDYTTTVRR